MTLIEKIQIEMVRRNISKMELAKRLGVSPSSVTRILKNPGINLRIRTLNRICKALEMAPEIFLQINTHH